MIELRTYKIEELSSILNTQSRQGLTRKLERYGIRFRIEGRGSSTTITVLEIENPFKIYCITELGIAAQSEFRKILVFYYLFFNDEEFATMPAEAKERFIDSHKSHISRQTIANYENKLYNAGLFYRSTENFVYYFAGKDGYHYTSRETYCNAWREYYDCRNRGVDSFTAIWFMKEIYGGVARKQAVMEENGIYAEKIEYFNQIILNQINTELSTNFSQTTNTNK